LLPDYCVEFKSQQSLSLSVVDRVIVYCAEKNKLHQKTSGKSLSVDTFEKLHGSDFGILSQAEILTGSRKFPSKCLADLSVLRIAGV